MDAKIVVITFDDWSKSFVCLDNMNIDEFRYRLVKHLTYNFNPSAIKYFIDIDNGLMEHFQKYFSRK